MCGFIQIQMYSDIDIDAQRYSLKQHIVPSYTIVTASIDLSIQLSIDLCNLSALFFNLFIHISIYLLYFSIYSSIYLSASQAICQMYYPVTRVLSHVWTSPPSHLLSPLGPGMALSSCGMSIRMSALIHMSMDAMCWRWLSDLMDMKCVAQVMGCGWIDG